MSSSKLLGTNYLGYWKLYAEIKGIKVCRTCGKPLKENYLKLRRGKLCPDCNLDEVIRGY